jgi:urea transport system permease protein
MIRMILLCIALLSSALSASAQTLQELLAEDPDAIAHPSRRTVGEVIDALIASGLPEVPQFLERWQAREVWQREADGLFFLVEGSGPYTLIDISTGQEVGTAEKGEIDQIKPNSGVRGVIGSALVRFQLLDPDTSRRNAALDAIARDAAEEHLEPLRASIADEPDPTLHARKERLERLLTARFETDSEARIEAIESLSGDVSVDARAVLSQLLTTREAVAAAIPEGTNLAGELKPGRDFTVDEAYAKLASAGLAQPTVSDAALRDGLIANIEGDTVGGVPVDSLGDPDARVRAYRALAEAGAVPSFVPEADRETAVEAHRFYLTYDEPDSAVTDAARSAQRTIEFKLGLMQAADLGLDALSLASIYFLAAIGLAITFGVMGVINMAHGEFIMMGAYTGFVVQQFVPDYTISLIVALPLAFLVTFGAGVAMERLVIRHLYNRPLETLLATFGISVALQQLAKNIFGTQARPLTAPSWLDGAWVMNDVVSISHIRIAIFVLALFFLAVFFVVMRHTRFGLETRAVTQNRRMAGSMGINPERVNMLTFGLGSGIAGVAGVAIGLFAKVTSELGSDYIVQSFMTVVVGGVGNIWGTLAGAALIGFLQKGIEWLNPSNTLAAQTYMIIFIIVFIQFRPRGIIALKGRAAGD